jgi:methionyl-tRNA formyltransferase
MTNIRVAFFGTSDRSIAILEALKSNFNLVACVTKSDVNVGRHQEKKETGVKSWAKTNSIHTITIGSLKGLELEALIEQLITANIDYIIVADFSFIIPEILLERFPNKFINIHFSLLPKYRGASPVQFAILNGDDTTGITYHIVVRKMDAGAIIHQIGYKMAHNETSGFLYDSLFQLAARELPEILEKYHNGEISLRTQDESEASYTLSPTNTESTFIYKEDAEIDWKMDAVEINRAVRAFNPWPISWTSLGQLENNKKLWNSKIALRDSVDKTKKVKIYQTKVTEQNTLEIVQLQLEGKGKVSWKEFENGYLKA